MQKMVCGEKLKAIISLQEYYSLPFVTTKYFYNILKQLMHGNSSAQFRKKEIQQITK
jgi:type IV secretory pathway VirB4 component